MIERMVAGANADSMLATKGKFVDLSFELAVGDESWVVQFQRGKVSAGARRDFEGDPAFTIRAGADAWRDFCQPVPPPGTHDILALFEGERLTLSGDMLLLFRNLMLVKRVLAKARRSGDAQ
jgi:hypothetical protein